MTDPPTADFGDPAQRLADEARDLPPTERARFLDQRCGQDDELRRRVEALLTASSHMTETLDPSTARDGIASGAPGGFSAAPSPPPREIGPYKVLEQLGEGGFGTVFLAEQSAPVRRRVAIKIIKPGMDSRAIVARFEQERQALAIMDHPNIAKVLDAGASPDGRPFFVMEYVAGEPITTYCDKARLSVQDRLQLFISVCEAVQHAHHKGIIHRDIKPSNVLVTIASGSPVVKIIDFGVAKALSHTLTDKTIFTEHGQILGTPEYMSPEQAEMGALDIDTRTDVYSLGVLLYELLTGAVPFEAKELRSKGYNEIQRIIREVDPPKPSTKLRSLGAKSEDVANRRHTRIEALEGQLRRELEWIPLKAMRKDRNERYDSPLAMAGDIRNHLAGRPLLAGPESAIYRARKFVLRNRIPVAATAAVLAALVLGAIGSTVGFVKASQQRDRADAEARRATDEAARLRQVVLYVTSMLGSANPASGDRKNVTVRELLDDAVARLDAGALKDQPRNEAALRAIIGSTYRSLSLWDKAEPQWRRALEMERAAVGAASPEASVALAGLGQVQLDTGRLDEAAKSLEEALTAQRAALNPDDFRIGDTVNHLGLLADLRGDLKSAEARYAEALAIYQKTPADAPRVADATTNLATVAHKLGDGRRAVELATQALAMRRQSSGPRSVDVWNSLVNLAAIQEATGDLAGAEQTRRDALALANELVDPPHRMLVTSLSALARTLWLRGGNALVEADKTQAQAAEMAQKIDGARAASVAVAVDLQAVIARDRGELERAIDLFRQALAIRVATVGPEHPDAAAHMSQLADTLARAGKSPEEAIKLAEAALTIRKKAFPEGHWTIWNTTSVLGSAYAAAGRFDEAEPLLLQSFEGLKSSTALGGRPRLEAVNRLIFLHEKMGRSEDAARWRQTRDALSMPPRSP